MKSSALIRQDIRQQRASLSEQQQRLAADTASQLAYKQSWFKEATSIAAYISVAGEMDPLPLVTQLSATQQLLLPVLRHDNSNSLRFVNWKTGDPLHLNRYKIPEPSHDKQPLPAEDIGVILMPLVAFDTQGNRIGMGGGYYDRTLAFINGADHFKRPLLVGYAYDFQKVHHIKINSWDIPLDIVITEKHVYQF